MTLKNNTRSSHAKMLDMLIILVMIVSACLLPARVTPASAQSEGVNNKPIKTLNLLTLETNDQPAIKETDLVTGTTTLVSVSSEGIQGNNNSFDPSISTDGRFVAFHSAASNLVKEDTNGKADVFVHDRQTGETTRVSVSSEGIQGDFDSFSPSISSDGRFVAFSSFASNLVDGDTIGQSDVFVHDRQTGETTRVSVSDEGIQGNFDSFYPSISADGRFVAFHSDASNLVNGETNRSEDVFVHDRQTGETTRVSVSSEGIQGNSGSSDPSISADGRFVAFHSYASNLVNGDTNNGYDVFVHDRQTGETTRVSVSDEGIQGNDWSFDPSISADGRFVTFWAWASNLVNGDTNNVYDVFVHDRQTGETTRVSVSSEGIQGNSDSSDPSISADGRFVAFVSLASNLANGDTNNVYDVFVHDRQTGDTTRVSVSSEGIQGNDSAFAESISADGRFVAFDSWASNLVISPDPFQDNDVFVHDRGGPPPPPPVTISHIEVNQALGVQKGGEWRFVAGKSTIIRVFLDTPVFVNSSTQNLEVTRDASISTILYPNKYPGKTNVLEFYCPSEIPACGFWPAGEYSFKATVDEVNLTKTATFTKTEKIRILVKPIRIIDGFETVDLPNDDWKKGYDFLRKTYPVAEDGVEWEIDGNPFISGIYGVPWIMRDFNIKFTMRYAVWQHYLNFQYDVLIGILPPIDICNKNTCTFGYTDYLNFFTIAMSNGSFDYFDGNTNVTNNIDNMQQIVAHEIGHAYYLGDEYDQKTANYECDINPPPPGYKDNICGEKSASILDWGSGMGSLISGSLNHPYEVNGRGLLSDKLSFMGGADELQEDYWVSPNIYSHLFDKLQVTQISANSQASEIGRVLLVSGSINLSDDITIFPWYHIETFLPELNQGDYSIEAVDNNGNVLASQFFNVSYIDQSNPPMEMDETMFQVAVAFPDNTAKYIIKKGIVELKSVVVNTQNPTVSITSPNGGEVWDIGSEHTITWDGISDGSVYYTVFFSPDGVDWQVLSANITERTYTIDTKYLSGSETALIKILATDGINTVEDISDAVFTVASKPPEAQLFYPSGGEIIPFGKSIVLDGNGYDLEDGLISGNSIEWYSNIDGALGGGSQLLVNLSVGHHTLTLKVTDSDNNIGSTNVNVDIVPCYLLSISHSGQGSDPSVTPGCSDVCPIGMYLEGEPITLSGALPDSNWLISGWTGTSNDGSITSTNSLTMPANDHWVSVNYIADTFPPAVPTLKSPSGGATVRGTPAYSWDPAADAAAFYFQYDNDSDFSSPIFTSDEFAVTSYTPPLQAPGIYYWHVKARDAAGNWSNWSDSRTITIKPLIPVAPVLVSPVAGKFTNDNTPTFTWKSVPDGYKYRIQISKTSTFTSPIIKNIILAPGVLTYTVPPLGNGRYYWRVRGFNTLNEGGAWSTIRNFTVDTVKPAAPLLASPANGASVIGIPTYKWRAVTAAKYYQFSYATNSTFTTGVFRSAKLTVLSFKPANQAKKTWYWRVRAQDAAGNWSNWSLVRKIIIR